MEKIKTNKFYWPKFDLFKRESAFVYFLRPTLLGLVQKRHIICLLLVPY